MVRGGAAVHYGLNNVGGIVNFVTKPIPADTSQTLRKRVTVAEDTGNVFTDTYYRAGGQVTDKLDLQFQANVQRGDGFRDHSDTEVDNLVLDVRYYLNDQHELASQLQYYRVDAELPGSLTPEAYEQDRTQSQRNHDKYEADMTRATVTWTYTPVSNMEFLQLIYSAGPRWIGQPGVSAILPVQDIPTVRPTRWFRSFAALVQP